MGQPGAEQSTGRIGVAALLIVGTELKPHTQFTGRIPSQDSRLQLRNAGVGDAYPHTGFHCAKQHGLGVHSLQKVPF
jgi:hypothetical protein